MKILINHVACDWLTIGTWNYEALKVTNRLMLDIIGDCHVLTGFRPPGMKQYIGNWHESDGHYFFGSGEQDGQIHHVVTAGGWTSSKLLDVMAAHPDLSEHWRCTRIDVQRTLPRPDEWSQAALLMEVRGSGRATQFHESSGGALGMLATVYIGSMKSARFARVYEKVVDGKVWLRCEVEFKKLGGADALFKRYVSTDGKNWSLASALQGFLCGLRNERLTRLFETETAPDMPRLWRGRGKTAEWLLKSVLPAFTRVIQEHDIDGDGHEVLRRFEQACVNQRKRGGR